nr:hypothetical protein CFP56_72473 [Quercus suber]
MTYYFTARACSIYLYTVVCCYPLLPPGPDLPNNYQPLPTVPLEISTTPEIDPANPPPYPYGLDPNSESRRYHHTRIPDRNSQYRHAGIPISHFQNRRIHRIMFHRGNRGRR